MGIVQSAREISYAQRERVVEKLLRELKVLKGATIGLLGLAFKPNTDALRDAPALEMLGKGRRECSESGIEVYDSRECLAADADALIDSRWAGLSGGPVGGLGQIDAYGLDSG
jgi:UDPglucose 6-dehydrogenase